ncbi:MAG: hypothetical protein IJ186_02140 [Bacilli bacterium]|nr:hypothetical protein [Bacilli bacterium]
MKKEVLIYLDSQLINFDLNNEYAKNILKCLHSYKLTISELSLCEFLMHNCTELENIKGAFFFLEKSNINIHYRKESILFDYVNKVLSGLISPIEFKNQIIKIINIAYAKYIILLNCVLDFIISMSKSINSYSSDKEINNYIKRYIANNLGETFKASYNQFYAPLIHNELNDTIMRNVLIKTKKSFRVEKIKKQISPLFKNNNLINILSVFILNSKVLINMLYGNTNLATLISISFYLEYCSDNASSFALKLNDPIDLYNISNIEKNRSILFSRDKKVKAILFALEKNTKFKKWFNLNCRLNQGILSGIENGKIKRIKYRDN